MGYGRALLQKDVRQEEAALQKKATKKSLWASIGRTVGGLGVMALTGGAVNPITLGLLTGGASFLGGAIGAKASGTGDLSKQGKFFKSDREAIQKELGAFGTQNLMSSLKSGLTAGIGQKLKLMKSGETAAKGLDFQDSFVGKTKFGKEIVSKQYFKDQGLSEFVDPNLQVGTESGKKIIAMDRGVNRRLGMGTGGETNYLDQIGKTAIPSDKMIPTNTLKDTARSMFWDDPDMTLNPWEMKGRHQTEQLMQNYGDWGKFNPETGENLQYERVVTPELDRISGLRKSIGDY
jgi:hypothetical protein